MEKKILIDTDGVIRDFVGGAEKKWETKFDFTLNKSIQKLLGLTLEDFENQLDSYQFWSELELTREAKPLFQLLGKYFKRENVYLISSSLQTPKAIAGCLYWYKKYMPLAYKEGRIIFAKDKSLLAKGDKVLLDDHGKTCSQFATAGGWSVLFPRPWNLHNRVLYPLDKIELELDMILHYFKETDDGQERVSSSIASLQS